MSNYIMDLRQVVGHRCLLQVGASVILVGNDGKILLQRRKDNHCWAYHGGSVELDEDTEEAARRELREETGLTAGKMEILGVFSGQEMHYVYPNGDEVSNVDVVYICRQWTGTMRMQESEVEDLAFFDPLHLPEPLFSANVMALKKYQRLCVEDAYKAENSAEMD